jgi:hypothetical protein
MLKEVRKIGWSVTHEFTVYDLGHDGVSEVVATSVESGRGTADGWKPIVLYQEHFYNDLGSCGLREWG